ncbi:SDR family NAD(P)-dependent oxidoreductase [Amedibacillus sp. YH-ame10]
MKALITGASSGIGRDMAKELAKRGCDLVLVARRGDRLQKLKEELSVEVDVIVADLSKEQQCRAVYERVKYDGVDILINNAGFGDFGEFDTTDLDKELQMIRTNIEAVHILTKLFLKDFVKNDKGMILNVASSAAFLPGPLMATYYATKSYVLRLSMGIHKELKKKGSMVSISVLCPGPVRTEFDKVANVKFMMRGKKSKRVAKDALEGMMNRKLLIIPGVLMKASYFLTKFMPNEVLMECSYHIQHRKNK